MCGEVCGEGRGRGDLLPPRVSGETECAGVCGEVCGEGRGRGRGDLLPPGSQERQNVQVCVVRYVCVCGEVCVCVRCVGREGGGVICYVAWLSLTQRLRVCSGGREVCIITTMGNLSSSQPRYVDGCRKNYVCV